MRKAQINDYARDLRQLLNAATHDGVTLTDETGNELQLYVFSGRLQDGTQHQRAVERGDTHWRTHDV